MTRPVALITGGGTGIGAATAARLAGQGFDVVLAGRREDKLRATAEALGAAARYVVMDVADPAAVAAGIATCQRLDVVVCNAGGAIGLEPVATADPADWLAMYRSNVLGTLHTIQAALPLLHRSPRATIVIMGSTAGTRVYEGGGGYHAAKFAEHSMHETLRLELSGTQIRVCEIQPGMVHTDYFSQVRFRGDQAKADATYAGVDRPLVADDVAACVEFVVMAPQHVNIDTLVVRPVAQAQAHKVARAPIAWSGR